MSTHSFSRQVKDELIQLARQESDLAAINLLVTLLAAGKTRSGTLSIATSHPDFARLIDQQLGQLYGHHFEWQSGRELINLSFTDKVLYARIQTDMDRQLSFDLKAPSDRTPDLTDHQRQAVLRAMFLACGSLSEPAHAYHLEFSARRQSAAVWLLNRLAECFIRANLLRRQGYSVLYVKEGQHIADFLLQSGAHQSLLSFESLRVEKEMRNSVNRVVNCDSANLQRIANTSARQLEQLRYMEKHIGLGLLPEELQAAAQARLAHPDLSLKELGETLEPPLGKSGMNHRMKRLEKLALDHMTLSKSTGRGHAQERN